MPKTATARVAIRTTHRRRIENFSIFSSIFHFLFVKIQFSVLSNKSETKQCVFIYFISNSFRKFPHKTSQSLVQSSSIEPKHLVYFHFIAGIHIYSSVQNVWFNLQD